MLINFATEQKLVILADEVYQENVYREAQHRFPAGLSWYELGI